MYISKYNLYVRLDDHPDLAIIQNLFHGQATLVPRILATYLEKSSPHGRLSDLGRGMVDMLRRKGFVYDDRSDEDEQISAIYTEFKKSLPSANPSRQYQLILTYDCNLRCLYCFQKKVRREAGPDILSRKQLQRIFSIILEREAANDREVNERNLPTRVPLISIVGGEPLLDSPALRERIATVVDFARDNGFHYSLTTNGVFLASYLSLFRSADYFPRDIQVTIDGSREYHDRRRPGPGGAGSFDAIVQGIDRVLAEGERISLRINIDAMNVSSIHEIADYILEKGWSGHDRFSAYLAPVTDHSAVNQNYRWLQKDETLIRRIVEMFSERPELEAVFTMKNFRGFQYVKRIVQNEGRSVPTLWRCEAVLGQLVFDPRGNLYTCFEGAGNHAARIGTYSPHYVIDEKRERAWKDLNAFTNRYCRHCRYRFVCSSGCPWHIVGQGATECLPIEKEIQLAWNYYAPRVIGDGVEGRLCW